VSAPPNALLGQDPRGPHTGSSGPQ
jgi:hypothetical protein